MSIFSRKHASETWFCLLCPAFYFNLLLQNSQLRYSDWFWKRLSSNIQIFLPPTYCFFEYNYVILFFSLCIKFLFRQVLFRHWIFVIQLVYLKETVGLRHNVTWFHCTGATEAVFFFREPYEDQWWNIRRWLAVAQPEGCNESSINRSSWLHSMKWRDHESWQMHLQLLMGTEHQRPSPGHMKDPFQRWQDTVKLPFSLLIFKNLSYLCNHRPWASSSQDKGQKQHIFLCKCTLLVMERLYFKKTNTWLYVF